VSNVLYCYALKKMAIQLKHVAD